MSKRVTIYGKAEASVSRVTNSTKPLSVARVHSEPSSSDERKATKAKGKIRRVSKHRGLNQFVTLTTESDFTVDEISLEFKKVLRKIRTVFDGQLHYIFIVEGRGEETKTRPHIHVLLHHDTKRYINEFWTHGHIHFTKVKCFDKTADYLVKEIREGKIRKGEHSYFISRGSSVPKLIVFLEETQDPLELLSRQGLKVINTAKNKFTGEIIRYDF